MVGEKRQIFKYQAAQSMNMAAAEEDLDYTSRIVPEEEPDHRRMAVREELPYLLPLHPVSGYLQLGHAVREQRLPGTKGQT